MERRTLTLEPIADDPEVGRWLAALQDARERTLRELADLPDAAVDWRPTPDADSIGTLLYHVALIEADWLVVEIMGLGATPPAWVGELFPHEVRAAGGQLTGVAGLRLADHLKRLTAVRARLLERMQTLSNHDFHRARALETYDVAPDWVLHHLLQHEAEHRAQVAWLKGAHAAGNPGNR